MKRPGITSRGVKWRGPRHAYRVIQVGNSRYIVEPWRERVGKRHSYVVIETEIITNPDFTVTIDYRNSAAHLKHHSLRWAGGFDNLPDALRKPAEQIEASE